MTQINITKSESKQSKTGNAFINVTDISGKQYSCFVAELFPQLQQGRRVEATTEDRTANGQTYSRITAIQSSVAAPAGSPTTDTRSHDIHKAVALKAAVDMVNALSVQITASLVVEGVAPTPATVLDKAATMALVAATMFTGWLDGAEEEEEDPF